MGMWMTRFARGRLAVVVLNFLVLVLVFIYPIVVVRQRIRVCSFPIDRRYLLRYRG